MPDSAVRLLGNTLFASLAAAAAEAPRRRKNHNLHASPQDAVQRFFNAIEPGSYVRPHRHAQPHQEETLLVLQGRLGLLCFDDRGALTLQQVLSPGSENQGATIAPGHWHSAVALEPGTVFFEVKAGPYDPACAAEFADWAPAEGSAEAAAFERAQRARFV